MQSKASLILEKLTNYRRFSTTLGFVQLGQDVEAIISSPHLSFGSGGRNPAGLLLVNLRLLVINLASVPG